MGFICYSMPPLNLSNMNTIKILNRKLVKPSSPTPPHLQPYKFSFVDENLRATEVGVLLFYDSSKREKHIILEEALSKILVQFYPLAGRFNTNNQAIDCNDQGAEFVKAEAPNTDLASLLVERNLENLYGFLPRETHQVDVATYPILSIQITEIKNGGLVIGISISHKIFDASSVSTFVAAWSNATNLDGNKNQLTIKPTLNTPSVFPAKNPNKNPISIIHSTANHKMSVKRFTFNKETIANLRSSLRPNDRVSRVRLTSAVISRALIRVDQRKIGRSRDCLILQAVNLRERTNPPLHKHECGNIILMATCRRTAAAQSGIQELVDLLGDATSKSLAEISGMMSLSEDARNDVLVSPVRGVSQASQSGEANVIMFSDYSKFGFYEADFGWGKPVWAAIEPQPSPIITVLMENREGDGIEAWVHLNINDMVLFQEDDEIRSLCNLG